MGAASSSKVVGYGGTKPKQNEQFRKEGRYFVPTEKVAWLIGNTDYSSVRIGTGDQRWKDIAQAHMDVNGMSVLFNELGFTTFRTENAKNDMLDA